MTTTPHNHVLIDYENVQPELASRLAPGFFKVWFFVGALQSKVKFDLVDLLQAKDGGAKVIKVSGICSKTQDFNVLLQCRCNRPRKFRQQINRLV